MVPRRRGPPLRDVRPHVVERPVTRIFSSLALVLLLAGCPKHGPDPVVFEAASRSVTTAADVVGAEGVPATVVGKLEERQLTGVTGAPAGGVAGVGTAIVLEDGTAIWLSEEPPPVDWEWMMGTTVRLQGTLWEHPEGGWAVPKLLDAETPMPADVSILLGPPPG